MEIALTILAQSCGVEIRSGTAVSMGRSRLDGPDPMLVIRGPSGREPGSLPGGLRRERSCLGAGTFTGNAPQAETHQHECVLVALPENGIGRDTGLGRPDDTPHLLPAGLVLVHQPVFLGELPHSQPDRDDQRPAR